MPRVRDQEKFNQSREMLLEVGQKLFINSSFNSVGLNDILKEAGIPKGSFYHYFESKEDFGLQVIEFYAQQNVADLEAVLAKQDLSPYQKLKMFFQDNIQHFEEVEFCQGCLMANLSQELADVNERLRCKINESSQHLISRIAGCIDQMAGNELNLGKMGSTEAAQVLMNSWQGAIMRMKLEKSRQPLDVFMKFFFSH